MEFDKIGIAATAQGLRAKEFSAVELCQSYLEAIKKKDGRVNAYLEVLEKSALSQAEQVDRQIAKGEQLPILAGMPLAIKDNILVKAAKCTAGSKILENYIGPYDATVISRLKEQSAVILGKTNLDEFGMGSSTENSAFGPTKNPHNLERVPGGSSGGSAAAVAANMAIAALGSDTGGSIRQPSAFCGVAGLKPTYGAVSRRGLIAMASSLDQIGPIAKSVEDVEIVFDAIKGRDEQDATSVNAKSKIQMNNKIQNPKFKIENFSIGVPKEYFIKGMDESVEKVVGQAIKFFQDQNVRVKEISLPHTEYALACYYIIMSSEVSANLARYDGIRYGKSKNQIPRQSRGSPTAADDEQELKFQPLTDEVRPAKLSGKIQNLLEVYLETRQDFLGPEVKRRIMLGTFALSAGYYQAYYNRALKVRTKIRQDFQKAFEKADVILAPVTPTPAFKLGEKIQDPVTMYLSDIFTVSANLAGLPGLAIPCQQSNGLPVAFQLIANAFEEKKLFEIGKIYPTL